MRRFQPLIFRTLGAALVFLLACSRPEPGQHAGEGPPSAAAAPAEVPSAGASLLLVTLDTWRWDYIGVSGGGKVATPNLDRLAREGVYEPEAETPYPLTSPAHGSLLTGLLPLHHGLLDVIGYRLAPGTPTLAEAFQAKGFGTAAFISSIVLDRRHGLDRGFQAYDEGSVGGRAAPDPNLPERDGAETTAAALRYLAGRPPGEPLFLWVHYYDMHWPYRSRSVYDAKYPGDAYAAQTAFVDDEVGKLVAALRADAGRSWRLILVGDHGEGFFDHHEKGHGMALYRSTLHVPLILYPKPSRPLAHAKPWRLEDLDPTAREWFGLGAAGVSDGESLFRAGGSGRLLPSLTVQPSVRYNVNPCLGVRRDALMYMRHGAEELYDLAADPGESRDLAGDPGHRKIFQELRAACDGALPAEKLQGVLSRAVPTQQVDLQGLQGLGYIGGYVPDMGRRQRAHIHQVCDDEAAFEHAKQVYRASRDPDPMQRAYEELLGRYPRAALFQQQFGLFLLGQRDLEGAAVAFERALRVNARDTVSLVNLGGLELARGWVDRARLLFESALALDPDDPVSHKNLGIIYSQYLKDPAKAVAHYRRYLEIGPDSDEKIVREYIRSVEQGTR